MFLGTSRIWWALTGVVFVVGLVLLGSDLAGDFSTLGGVLLVILAMILFAAAPRKRRDQPTPSPEPEEPIVQSAAPEPPRPRPAIEGRDPSEV